jgi:tRNA dimethylallyltransferase
VSTNIKSASAVDGVVLVLTGPTTSGKTGLSVELSRRLPIEIISMDSRQVYKGMDIGTDKVRREHREMIPHHGLDLVAPGQRYSAGQFGRDARRWSNEIVARGRIPTIVGGTGFFLKTLVSPIFSEPPLDPSRRERLREWLGAQSTDTLSRFVLALDPDRAEISVGGGPQRMARTIEVSLLTGVPLSRWHAEAPAEAPGLRAAVVVLELPREEIDRRIEERVCQMVERGLEREVRALISSGYGEETPGMTATGYREMVRYVRGDMSLAEAKTEIVTNTKRYARRQLTWFRHQLPSHAVTVDATQPVELQADSVVRTMHARAAEVSM